MSCTKPHLGDRLLTVASARVCNMPLASLRLVDNNIRASASATPTFGQSRLRRVMTFLFFGVVYFYHPRMRRGNVFSRICLCVGVCLSVCNALSFDSPDL